MKFTIPNRKLAYGIDVVKNAVGSPVMAEVVENIYIVADADQNALTFTATNMNMTVRCQILDSLEIQESGETLLPASLLTRIVHDLPEGEVTFDYNKEKESASIQCGRFRAKIKGGDPNLFPPFPSVDFGRRITVETEKLREITKKTCVATSKDASRYQLGGVLFAIDGATQHKKRLDCVATDGRRLAIHQVYPTSDELFGYPRTDLGGRPLMGEDDFFAAQVGALISSETLNEVFRVLPGEGTTDISFGTQKVALKHSSDNGSIEIVSSLLGSKASSVAEINFPNYQRIIPPKTDLEIRVKRADLASAVKRVANLASNDTNQVRFSLVNDFPYRKFRFEISGEREETGSRGKDFVDADVKNHERLDPEKIIETGFNHKFVSDFLKVVGTEEISLNLVDDGAGDYGKKPCILSGVDDGNGSDGDGGSGGDMTGSYRYVLMPMRRDNEE